MAFYTDIDLRWKPHPLTGNVNPLADLDSIRASIKNLFRLRPFDVPFNPYLSVGMEDYLFDNITILTASNIRKRIEWVIKSHERRVKILDIKVIPFTEQNGFEVEVSYLVKAINANDKITDFFQRVR